MVDLAVLGLWLDSMIFKVFSNQNDSMSLFGMKFWVISYFFDTRGAELQGILD